MNESDSIKKLIMDLASQIVLDEHLDAVRFQFRELEYLYRDYISVTFYKGQQAVSNLFPIYEFLDMKSDLCQHVITSCLREMIYRLKGDTDGY